MEVVDNRSFKEKVRDKWERAKIGVSNARRWVAEHPQETVAIALGTATIIGSAAKGGVAVSREIRRVTEDRDERLRVWDPVNGIYLYTKRPMTGAQKLEFSRRAADGESRAEILQDMKILNKWK